MSHILIVEDEPVIRGALRKLLERNEHSVVEAGSVEDARQQQLDDFDLIISDLRLPGVAGTELIQAARPAPVLIMTSFASLRSAVDAMRLGAVDYIAKPFDHDEMLLSIDRILRESRMVRQNELLQADIAKSYPVDNIIAESPIMQDILHKARKVALAETPVLLLGEPGSGKELIARAIHGMSKRSDGPFTAINCAAIPGDLLETEIFGEEKHPSEGKSRRGLSESANGGILFLDEVGALDQSSQVRLMRIIESGELCRVGCESPRRLNVRIIVSSTHLLQNLVSAGHFREDLYYRLSIVTLTLPPLRERHADLPVLARAMLSRLSEQYNCGERYFTQEAISNMQNYDWPGNIRELENTVERAVILGDSAAITPELIAINPRGATLQPRRSPAALHDSSEDLSLEDYFTRFVLENQDTMTETELAQKLGISRKCLWERRQRLNIPRKKSANG